MYTGGSLVCNSVNGIKTNDRAGAVNGGLRRRTRRGRDVTESHPPLGEQVYSRLVDMIVHGDLEPGAILREQRLAQSLGTSRVPVREALQRLADEGWVDRQPRVGARLRVPTTQDIDEIYDLRRLLEAEAVRLAARHISMAHAERLRDLITAGTAAADADDQRGVVEANSAFHNAIGQLTGNALLCQFLKLLDTRGRWLFATVAQSRAGQSLPEHGEILAALERGDVDEAVRWTILHVENTRQALHEHWKQSDHSSSADTSFAPDLRVVTARP